ncbi:RNA polymerase sigma factor [Dyadobacter crusticola]|uniref:RNA polymerase sigma factor n=1 Tax=Dyadobacter crusticola TaxID=292407 RepID=UPI0004E0E05A|nr:sigma-70 family RNA polymerase sigma factor [Dyadobacter crusticola]
MNIGKLYDERETLAALAQGDELAFAQIFQKHSPRVYSVALKFLDSREAAEEIVQDIFMDIWLRREKMTEVLNLGGYLQGMVRKQVYDAYRKKMVFSDLVTELNYPDQSANSTEQLIQEHDYERFLEEIISKLPGHQQEIYRLAKEEELSHEEIAQRLNLSRLAVKSHMKRILSFIRVRLEPLLKAEMIAFISPFLMN